MSTHLRTVEEFNRAYAKAKRQNKPMVVFAYLSWCPHCKNVQVPFDDMVKHLTSQVADFYRINMEDVNPRILETYGVTSGPTYMVFFDDNLTLLHGQPRSVATHLAEHVYHQ